MKKLKKFFSEEKMTKNEWLFMIIMIIMGVVVFLGSTGFLDGRATLDMSPLR